MTSTRKGSATALLTIVRRALAGECSLSPGSKLLVAVSGGPDSMALLDALARVAPAFRIELLAHGVDHGLRAAAADELDGAQAFARTLAVPFDRTKVDVGAGGNLQARARKARWAALVATARRHGAAIATAHHADDRAETLLMRLLRGAGARGLGVLPARARAPIPGTDTGDAPIVVRPLLRARRVDIERHVTRNAIPHAHDPSNVDPRYLRTAVRRDVLPLLAKLDPNVVRHLEALADELVGDEARTSPIAEWARTLPRATQESLVKLAQSPSETARVWLPGGLVVSAGPSEPRAEGKRSARPRTRVVPPEPRG